MKTAIILALLALPVSAQITATFQTTRGNVLVTLQYDQTPQTVANFITLAQGTRSSYDAATGAVRRKRYYAGEAFYRVVNDPFFKIAQTGSGTGTNSGGPGYKFRDELRLPGLKHDPYVLAMANAGPNTNGSQIYFTGSSAIPSLDGKHTVFGLITDAASRTVIDNIMSAGNNGTTINDVTIQRVGAQAVAFNEFAHNLPACQGVPGELTMQQTGGFNNVTFRCGVPLPAASVFRVSNSQNLQSWQFAGDLSPNDNLPSGLDITIDQNLLSRRFYNISLTTYPTPIRQTSLSNRALELSLSGGGTITLAFNATGFAGNMTLSSQPGQSYAFECDHNPEAYGSTLYVYPVQAWPYPLPLLIVCGFDSETQTEVTGRHSTSLSNSTPVDSGSLTLSK